MALITALKIVLASVVQVPSLFLFKLSWLFLYHMEAPKSCLLKSFFPSKKKYCEFYCHDVNFVESFRRRKLAFLKNGVSPFIQLCAVSQ